MAAGTKLSDPDFLMNLGGKLAGIDALAARVTALEARLTALEYDDGGDDDTLLPTGDADADLIAQAMSGLQKIAKAAPAIRATLAQQSADDVAPAKDQGNGADVETMTDE